MTKSEETDALEKMDGVVRKRMHQVQHVTFEVGPSPGDLWAFRVTVHPFPSKVAALRGMEKMKTLLRPLGFSFRGDKT